MKKNMTILIAGFITFLVLSFGTFAKGGDSAFRPDEKGIDRAIEKTRKGDFVLSIANTSAGTEVDYTLERLDFELGTVINRTHFFLPKHNMDRVLYLNKIKKYFNLVMPLMYWRNVEPDSQVWVDEPYLEICRWAKSNGLRTRSHTIFYGWTRGGEGGDPMDDHLPFLQPWLRKLDKYELEAVMKRHLRHVLKTYDGYISRYDLNNEVMPLLGNKGGRGAPRDYFSKTLGFKNLAPYFKWAKEIAPDVTFYTNENSILSDQGKSDGSKKYVQMLEYIIESGGQVGGIGFQGHFNLSGGDRVGPSEEIWSKLDAFAKFKLPLMVTEFGVRATNPQEHAEDVRRFLRLCFAHPAMQGVNFWNIWEPDMFPDHTAKAFSGKSEAPLWLKDWAPTPAGEVYINLVTKEWMTKGSAKLDNAGKIKFRGFYGTYKIKVNDKEYTVELNRDRQPGVITLP
jgi:endo-1,4-beta-xylanase